MKFKDFIKIAQNIEYINFYANRLSKEERSKVLENFSIEDRKILTETLKKFRKVIKMTYLK